MQVFKPSQNIWKQLTDDFLEECKHNKSLLQQSKSQDLDFEYPVLFFFQLQNLKIFTVPIESIQRQISHLLFALEQNVSTQISLIILDILFQLVSTHQIGVEDLFLKNLGYSIVLKRIADNNEQVVKQCLSLLDLCNSTQYLLDLQAFNILVKVSNKLFLCNDSQVNSKLFKLLQKFCLHKKSQQMAVKLFQLIFYIKKLSTDVAFECFSSLIELFPNSNFLILLLIKNDFVDKVSLSEIKNSNNMFYVFYMLVTFYQNQQYFLNHHILRFYEIDLPDYHQSSHFYSKTLAILCFGNEEMTRNIIKNKLILNNLLRFTDKASVIALVQICNNAICLKLTFELQYLKTQRILKQYFTLLNYKEGFCQIISLKGLKNLAKLNYLDDYLDEVSIEIQQLLNSKNIEVTNRAKQVLNEIEKLTLQPI